jgi:hypothetical protein
MTLRSSHIHFYHQVEPVTSSKSVAGNPRLAELVSAAGESCRTQPTLPHRKELQFLEFINFAHKLESRNIYRFPNTEWEHPTLETLTPDSGESEKIAESYAPPYLYSFTYQHVTTKMRGKCTSVMIL